LLSKKLAWQLEAASFWVSKIGLTTVFAGGPYE
jgi:hypothetical protein